MVKLVVAIFLVLSVGLAKIEGKPQANDDFQYPSDYEYDNDAQGEEEEEINYDIKFVSKGSTHVVDKGTTIRLPCYIDKFPENFVIMWNKVNPMSNSASTDMVALGNSVMRDTNRISVELNHNPPNQGSTLVIGLADDKDAGQYVCQLGSMSNKEIKHTVKIREPPTIVKTPSNGLRKAQKGDDVILSCEGTGNPKPTITWTRSGKKLPDGRKSVEASELAFKSVTRHHSGTYVCTANNGYGQEAKDRIQLDVEFPPEVSVEEVFIHATEEKQVELVCNVHAHPMATVKWFKNSIELTDEDVKLEKLGHRHILTIPAISRNDFGNYTCRAKNILGEASTVVEVSGLAGFAEFKSVPRGHEAHTYLLEWTSQSQSPISEFELMWRPEGGQWEGFTVPAYKQSSFSWAGKHGFSGLDVATRYEARVSANNAEGWSRQSKTFHFATFGAEPVTGSGKAASYSLYMLILSITIVLAKTSI